ncbi:hypothetical protein T02_12083, partial [Trichinella nativa]
MHKNRFSAQRYANNDRRKGALSSIRAHSFKKSENGVDAKRNADGVMQNNKREKTEFERAKSFL